MVVEQEQAGRAGGEQYRGERRANAPRCTSDQDTSITDHLRRVREVANELRPSEQHLGR